MSLARHIEGRPASDDDLARWQLTRREYDHFRALYAQSTNVSGHDHPVDPRGAAASASARTSRGD
jgi:hypothetical protein